MHQYFVLIFTCVSYAEARNRYRLDVRLSVCLSVRLSHAGMHAEARLLAQLSF